MADITIPAIIGAATLAGAVVIAPVTKYALDIYPYLYTNTRCSSRLGLLLNKSSYEELIATTSENEFYALLEDSYYRDIVEHSRDFFSVSLKLEEDLYTTNKWLAKIVPDQIRPVIDAMRLRFEISSIKRILNSLKDNRQIEQAELDFIGNPQFKLRLEGVKDFQSFVSAAEGTDYSALFQNKNLGEMHEINTRLDKYYIGNLISAIDSIKDKGASGPFREYTRILADLFNIRSIIRSFSSRAGKTLIRGGNLNIGDLEGAADMAQLKSILSNSVYGELTVQEGAEGELDIENVIYKHLFSQAGNIAAKNTIKSGTITRFIILKEIEARNINAIAKLKAEDFKNEEIEKVLII